MHIYSRGIEISKKQATAICETIHKITPWLDGSQIFDQDAWARVLMLSRKAEIKEGWQFSLFYPTIGVIQQCLSVITYDVTATHSSSFCTVSEKKGQGAAGDVAGIKSLLPWESRTKLLVPRTHEVRNAHHSHLLKQRMEIIPKLPHM